MIKPVNGMKDLMHRAMPRYRKVIEETRSVLEGRYGYQEVMPNLVESERLYRRTLGVTSDIVLKEMYEVVAASTSITDKAGKVKDRNVLRPEGTAGVLRAILRDTELMQNMRKETVKVWYWGPMFRHERPQAGRLRQFYQVGMECVGGTKAGTADTAIDFGHTL